MILNAATNVVLTKVHYYDGSKRYRNAEIATISRRVMFDDAYNTTSYIRHNVFGHRWVLKINETKGTKSGNRWRIFVYLLVTSCILLAVGFGIYVSLSDYFYSEDEITGNNEEETKVPKVKIPTTVKSVADNYFSQDMLKKLMQYEKISATKVQHVSNGTRIAKSEKEKRKQSRKQSICNCTDEEQEVCLKVHPLKPPVCVRSLDRHDPSGCGGLCRINVQYCKLLDKERSVYECINNTNILKCPERHFNCGDMCVQERKRCDGFRHCKDNSDEIDCECNLESHFQCGNYTSCLEKVKKCDGKVDCWDSFDEIDCDRSCGVGEVPCLTNSECVPKARVCDGVVDCTDRSDEPVGCERS